MVDRFADRAREWNFNPRTIAMFEAFRALYRKEIPIDQTMDLLDVGGGTGLIAFDLAPSVNSVTIIDSSPAMISVARERIASEGIKNCTAIEGDVIKTSAGEKKFDRIHAHMSLHHIADLNAAIGRFYDLLRPSGLLIIADLVTEDGSFHGEDAVPHNGFAVKELADRLMKRGFKIVKSLSLPDVKKGEIEMRSYGRFCLVAER